MDKRFPLSNDALRIPLAIALLCLVGCSNDSDTEKESEEASLETANPATSTTQSPPPHHRQAFAIRPGSAISLVLSQESTSFTGQILVQSGKLELAEQRPLASGGHLSLDATSISFSDDRLSRLIHSPLGLDTENHPQIALQLLRVAPSTDAKGEAAKIQAANEKNGVEQAKEIENAYSLHCIVDAGGETCSVRVPITLSANGTGIRLRGNTFLRRSLLGINHAGLIPSSPLRDEVLIRFDLECYPADRPGPGTLDRQLTKNRTNDSSSSPQPAAGDLEAEASKKQAPLPTNSSIAEVQERLINRFDANGDKRLSAEEKQKMNLQARSLLDANKDGRIDEAERASTKVRKFTVSQTASVRSRKESANGTNRSSIRSASPAISDQKRALPAKDASPSEANDRDKK